MVKLTINGREIEAKKGETVLEVCRREGIRIPTLCYQDGLTPYGGCRLCVVEVEGMPRPMAACTLPASDGMVAKTDTPRINEYRKFALQLILSEHPHGCLVCGKTKECTSYMECIEKEPVTFGCKYCPKDGDCELQRLVDEYGIKDTPFVFGYRGLELERLDPFFERDYNLCILCGRCVRACSELRGASVIDFHHRGPKTLVGTAFNMTHIDARCQFCGACVDACPTGAMRERYSKYEESPEKSVQSVCGLCSLCCKINVNVRSNRVLNCTPDNSQLCVRGRFGLAQIVNHQKRVTVPLLKKEGRIVEVGWDEALTFAASKLSEYRGKVGMIFSPGLTIEAIDALTTAAELTGVEGFGSALGVSGNFVSACLEKRTKKVALVTLNTDLLDDFAVILLRMKHILEDRPVVVAIDTLRTKFTDIADAWLRPKPGTECEILRMLVAGKNSAIETGVSDKEIMRARRMLAKRDVCVLYNPYNTGVVEDLNNIHVLPLVSAPNFIHMTNLGIMDSEEVLQNASFECLYLVGADPMLKRPYSTVIVQDVFLPDFKFDLFLPAATFVEIDGSFIDIDGKVRKLHKAVEPPGKSNSDEWIIKEITSRLDFEMMNGRKRDRISLARKGGEVVVTSEYPFYLIIRENCYRFRNKALSRLLKGFERLRSDSCVHINSKDAIKLQVNDNEEVKITGHDLNLIMKAIISDDVPEGVVFAYHNPGTGLLKSTAVNIARS